MHRSGQIGRTLVIAAAALALLAGCSNGNKNNNKSGNSASNAAASSAATTAATVAVRTATPVPTARPTTAAVATRTPTPAATVVRTATPAIARAASPSAGSPSAGAPSAGALPTDAALQKTISDAALKEADLPAGYTLQGKADTSVNLAGQSAGYSVVYVNLSKIPQIQAVAIVLGGFKDQATATADFSTIEQSVAMEAGGDFKLTPEPNGPKLGDDTKSFKLSGTTSGISLGGYAIIWRRGRITSAVVLLGNPDIQSVNDVTPLAQKQDDRLKAAGQ